MGARLRDVALHRADLHHAALRELTQRAQGVHGEHLHPEGTVSAAGRQSRRDEIREGAVSVTNLNIVPATAVRVILT